MDQLAGKTQTHLIPIPSLENFKIHQDALDDFLLLKDHLENKGFSLGIVSSFRSYENQKNIWNAKALGKRPLYNVDGTQIDFNSLGPKELLKAIMRWSAIPGSSRHHWGTDIDVYDKKTCPKNYTIELTPKECSPTGVFGKLHLELDQLIKNHNSFGFFRPYAQDLGGVSPEKWHISHKKTATTLLKKYDLKTFESIISQSDILLKELILGDLENIYTHYIINISQ